MNIRWPPWDYYETMEDATWTEVEDWSMEARENEDEEQGKETLRLAHKLEIELWRDYIKANGEVGADYPK